MSKIEAEKKIEDFVFQGGYTLRLIHCGEKGMILGFEHDTKRPVAIIIPPTAVTKLKKWLNENYGAFF